MNITAAARLLGAAAPLRTRAGRTSVRGSVGRGAGDDG